MGAFTTLLRDRSTPLVIPGAHDALSVRMIEDAGFEMLGIGGAGLAATQLGLPDIGVQSFGEYRDAIRRMCEASNLPMMVDGENGFGDGKAITRTVRSFADMGIAALALEDLDFPPRLGLAPTVIPVEAMLSKLRSAISARHDRPMDIIARTDAAYCMDADEAIRRAVVYQDAGADAVLAVGMPDMAALGRLRDAVTVPMIVLCVSGAPWYAPSPNEIQSIGAEAVIYPATVMLHMAAGIAAGLSAIRRGGELPQSGFGFAELAATLRTQHWAAIDRPPS